MEPPVNWQPLESPRYLQAPRPLTVRSESLAARHYFAEHRHDWNQMVYAISGVLTVNVHRRAFVISPEQAAWLPVGLPHRVGSLFGAEFRSLWILNDVDTSLPPLEPTVFEVSPLLKALIIEADAVLDEPDDDGYASRVTQLIVDQLRRARPILTALPWPTSKALTTLCETLYADPANPREVNEWCRALGMSERTLARHFVAETGMSLRSWRRRSRLFRAIELLGGGMSVTRAALELGYGSTSAFIYAFRQENGCSPQAYIRGGREKKSCVQTSVGSNIGVAYPSSNPDSCGTPG